MTQPEIPEHVRALADARAAARERRDWETADRLRADLEHGGWRIVDKGTRYRLTPAHPPNVDEGDGVRYGSSASVPSRLTEPATALATVVLRATDRTSDLARLLDGLRAHAPEETQVVVVADDPSPDQEDDLQARQRRDHGPAAAAAATDSTDASLPSLSPEVVWTSARVGHAAAINIGIRGAVGRIVVVLDDSVEPVGDFIEPLVRVLADPRVALCGPWGLLSGDLRHFGEAAAGKAATEAASGTAAPSVAAIQGACQAFR
nr:glycosyltransferase [Chloroflexota bacterium]